MEHRDKQKLREEKRVVKRAGNKRVRRQVKRFLRDKPEEIAHMEIGYGRYSSEEMNGIDEHAT